ncbi:MAG: DUF5054 domain-containing protein [Oscillibacter sp.]|nr:DUF5054 domain-containing protein [Oscillibacter sp.]
MKIILAFKTHFDIGFTQLASEIIDQYSGQMLSDVIETCNGTADMGKLHYVWTMPSWPLTVMQGSGEKRGELDRLVREGQIAFHALPFTSHTDFCGMADTIEGLRYASELSAEYDVPLPVSAKMTDVPGHGRSLPTLLTKAGIRFLHLGCNAYATPPGVPPLFFWQGSDGSRLLTMYSKGGYGSSMVPPADWPFPVWMALMHTHDNIGPQSADIIRAMVAEAKEACPDAEIVCGTMDDFYYELAKCDLSGLPVVTEDLADTWIHGVGSYPAEVRAVRQARRDLTTASAAVFAAGGDEGKLADAYKAAYDALCLFGEHTWGLDVKTWMKPERAYEKKAFRKAKNSDEYRRMEASWQEQRERAQQALDSAKAALQCAGGGEQAVFNPNASAFTGWAELEDVGESVSLCGRSMVYVKDVPPLGTAVPQGCNYPHRKNTLENHRYRLTFDESRGLITELYDKHLGCALAKERDGVGVFSYQYDIHGIEEMTEYLRNYAYRFFDWGIRDNGKDNYPEIPHMTFRPKLVKYQEDDYTLTLHYQSSAAEAYGDGRDIRVLVALPPEGEELFVSVEVDGKEETGYVESGSLCIPLAEDAPRFRFNKNGDLIDPATDILWGANHALYCLEAFACAESDQGGLCVVTSDAPLCAIGETGIYGWRKTYEETAPILQFNLFNNMWGTNFPQWIGGDLKWDFTLFGYEGACGGSVMDRALALERGVRCLPVGGASAGLSIPEGMQILTMKPVDGKWSLVLRDTAMTEREAVLAASGWDITQVDLRGRRLDEKSWERKTFSAVPFGIYAFELEKLI